MVRLGPHEQVCMCKENDRPVIIKVISKYWKTDRELGFGKLLAGEYILHRDTDHF